MPKKKKLHETDEYKKMKILLFGEFSGLHTNLKSGLEELGHEVTLLSTGDGFKRLKGDININIISKWKYISKLELIFKTYSKLLYLRNYDIVQLIHPVPLMSNFTTLLFIKILKQLNNKIYLNVCGSDSLIISEYIKYDYSPLKNELIEGDYSSLFRHLDYKKIRFIYKVAKNFDGLISSMYIYHESYKAFPNYLGFIPMPTELPKLKLKNTRGFQNDKIIIFHGITRSAFKGSKYILEAMNLVKIKFPELCEIKIVEKISYSEYTKSFNDCDIFIDQTSSYGYGMNALLGLAKGKIVLSGAHQEIIKELKLFNCPIINIEPDTKKILKILTYLIHKKSDYFIEMQSKAISYIKNVHEKKIVAKQYIEIWE